jgi:hypothetical protein
MLINPKSREMWKYPKIKLEEIKDREGSAALTTRHPSIRNTLAINFADNWRSLSRYSSLAD